MKISLNKYVAQRLNKEKMELKAILGLGNEGSKYKNTYHNVGQLMVDFLLEKNILPENIAILKNEGYMNESGNSALKILSARGGSAFGGKKIGKKGDGFMVIHDDSDLNIGDYKISINRGSAGHKGIQDIINKIGTQDFWRLRIGIRPTDEKDGRMKAEEFVLKKIKKEDLEILQKVFEEASSILTQRS